MNDLERYVSKNFEIVNNNFNEIGADVKNLFEISGRNASDLTKISGRVTRNGWGLAVLFGLGMWAYKKLESKIEANCDENAKNE